MAYISLGNFDPVVDEVLAWLEQTNQRLDDQVPLYGSPKIIETELSKLKVCKYYHTVLFLEHSASVSS